MTFDAVVVGSGPNGLAAAVALATWGKSVCLIEGAKRVGGALRCHSDLETGFLHDHCAAVHPLGILSPFYKSLGLEQHGLTWCSSDVSAAHPLVDGPTAILGRDFSVMEERLGPRDGRAWRALFGSLTRAGDGLFAQLMAPPTLLPSFPFSMLKFAWHGMRSAEGRATALFRTPAARALFAGLAAHSILPMERVPSAAVGLLFGLSAHLNDWPCVQGGSEALAIALESKFRSLGGEIRTGQWITEHRQLPDHRVALYDVSPRALVQIVGEGLPPRYRKRLQAYRYGPGVFKLDYTLDGPLPWKDPITARASTVHIGASLEEIATSEKAPFEGRLSDQPFLMVCQQSALDPSRAPAGKHTGYVYCHVPYGYDHDATHLIERQLDRFAPGFRDLVRQRRATGPRELEAENPNLLGGVIAGGVSDLGQLFTRPVARRDPYSTPNPDLFLCSASTPPAGGVHGMCGYYAARSALQRLAGQRRLVLNAPHSLGKMRQSSAP